MHATLPPDANLSELHSLAYALSKPIIDPVRHEPQPLLHDFCHIHYYALPTAGLRRAKSPDGLARFLPFFLARTLLLVQQVGPPVPFSPTRSRSHFSIPSTIHHPPSTIHQASHITLTPSTLS
ncbi:hypothetical protein AC578_3212 [Pseudocercospora eumusae]|uniref:Uncharacterized protein n=1 Tax=Pseudocercospora eumusae TaxID=321146 RepID=A0A139H5M6_9PEZI|nr:hypothetical protein AC578_3212 [Pseudocercospora eumusae]